MTRKPQAGRQRGHRGQSLTEFAVLLPIIIMLIGGIVEVGNLFVYKNRAALVAHETTRFLATGGRAEDALPVAQQTAVTSFGREILLFDEVHIDVYVITATVNSSGDAIEAGDFEETHIYPTQDYYDACCGGVDDAPESGIDEGHVYARLAQVSSAATLADVGVVSAVVTYQAESILDLPIFPQLEGRVPLTEYVVMRQEATIAEAAGSPTQGCTIFPLIYEEDAVADGGSGRTLADAQSGDEFSVGLGVGGVNNYNTLQWNGFDPGGDEYPPVTTLATSLGWDEIQAGLPPVGNVKDLVYGFYNAKDGTDRTVHRGDWVMRGPVSIGVGTDPGQAITNHMNTGRVLRVPLYDVYEQLNPAENQAGDQASRVYHMTDFMLAKVVAFNGSNMTIEFVRRDSSCGN